MSIPAPKKKVYIIIHDGNKLLVGKKGKSGWKKMERLGFHLPGGSVDGKEDSQAAAKRELAEETGIDGSGFTMSGPVTTPKAPGVDFVIAKVSDVDALVSAFKRPQVKNQYDEPFEELEGIPLDKCWENKNFDAKYATEWFASGLDIAQQHLKK